MLPPLPPTAALEAVELGRTSDASRTGGPAAGPRHSTDALVPGDGRGGAVAVRSRDLDAVAGPEGDFRRLLLPTAGLDGMSLQAEGGTLWLREAWLADPRAPLVAQPDPALPPLPAIELAPCGEGCDDGAALTAAIDAAEPGPLRVSLAAGRYLLRTPVTIRRDDVTLEGVGPDTLLFWDPEADAPRGAVMFLGRGRVGAALPLPAVASGTRRFPLPGADALAFRHARYASDDFGHIPATCINGRDQEHYQRHLGQLVRVLGTEGEGDARQIVLDRALNLDIPAEANPRLEPVELIQRGAVRGLRFLANCPEALENPRFARPECANPFVQGDAAVLFQWVASPRVSDVQAQAFGKFSVELTDTLEAEVTRYRMDHPSDYGEGGAGYGVHLITASRTVVHGIDVEHARHGVVVDFGASDSQILESHLRDMSQALIDVHGEASRDTLIRGNTLADSTLAVIVGGGGNVAHCNDGPRHHIDHNTMAGITNSGITVFDETRQVFARHNHIQGALFGLTVAFESGEVHALRNIFEGSRIPVQLATAGPVYLGGNVFVDACTPEAAVMVLNGVVEIAADNRFCPDR
ncbi:MAG: right-handed parallel beta-helix repeat-containing protein [bacterium]